ncbi:response regulator transcription factor [Kitasatospora sp. HPMI-4]|uniref:response regulator transcription factor n=1 Tax=Kitasatospora sp. HPMI-4 TaxID=3448443 RepID=UPI003F1A8F69
MDSTTRSRLRPEPAGIRVLILDESPITRTGLRAVLHQAGIQVVGEAGDQCEAVALLADTSPHVVVVHTGGSPADVAAALRKVRDWDGKVLALVGDGLSDAGVESVTKDADGTLLSSAGVEDLIAAVRVLVAGYSLFPAPAAPSCRPSSPGDVPSQQVLTPRERDVLRLLGRGRTNAEISSQLSLSESTVKSHVQNLLAKLGLRNRVEAALHAVEAGLVGSP